MVQRHRWLRQEIERWRAEGLIDQALAATLAERYPPPLAGRAWGQLIFSAIGAGIAGLGVILFFAYNWEALPKFVKLGLVFASLIAAHGAGLWTGARAQGPRQLSEGLHVLGTMLFGAGIWLVAQIYHIDGHYPDGIFIWSLAALAMAWAMQSLVQGLLAVTLIALWVGLEIFEFEWSLPWAPALVAVGVVPLAWLMRSRVLLFFGLLALVVVLVMSALVVDEDLALAAGFFTGAFYVLTSHLLARSSFPEAAAPARVLGFSVYLLFLFVFSFAEAADSIDIADPKSVVGVIYFAVPLVLAALAGLGSLFVLRAALDGYEKGHLIAVLVSVALIVGLMLASRSHLGWLGAIAFNLLFLAHCALFILQGSRDANAKLVGLACVLFVAIVLARYFDLFENLLVRAAVFVLLGGALFLIGSFYNRSRRRLAESVQ